MISQSSFLLDAFVYILRNRSLLVVGPKSSASCTVLAFCAQLACIQSYDSGDNTSPSSPICLILPRYLCAESRKRKGRVDVYFPRATTIHSMRGPKVRMLHKD